MAEKVARKRNSPLQILVHLTMAPKSGGSFSWSIRPELSNRLADDLRWIVLRKIFPQLGGKSPYAAKLQKHAIRVESLDREFFREVIEVVAVNHSKSFSLNEARRLDELQCLEKYFIPVILEWACCERSVSVSRERTPSIEELITHEDSSGNVYHRFPDEFSWAVRKSSPEFEPEPARDLPDEMIGFARKIASELTRSLRMIYENGKLDKYVLLMARLEDNVCTWDMTFNYLSALGVNRYSSWKSLSVVANRAMKEFVDGLPDDIRTALRQDDSSITKEEKHSIIRQAVNAALELDSLPTPQELLARTVSCP
ncbi:MAG TPA: hypothetical protein ENN67_03435 [Firmicutes bacterium]|nr:hypothetical protein [Bacillota bacterium]